MQASLIVCLTSTCLYNTNTDTCAVEGTHVALQHVNMVAALAVLCYMVSLHTSCHAIINFQGARTRHMYFTSIKHVPLRWALDLLSQRLILGDLKRYINQ
jgi:hypothetical protein